MEKRRKTHRRREITVWKNFSDSRNHREAKEFSAPGVFSVPKKKPKQKGKIFFSNSRVAASKKVFFWRSEEKLSIFIAQKMSTVEKC